jgi:hypothetical protein
MINSSWIDLYNCNLILNNFLVQQAVGLDNPVRYTINRKKKRYLIIRASRIPEIAEYYIGVHCIELRIFIFTILSFIRRLFK